jgi:hypothetical protein
VKKGQIKHTIHNAPKNAEDWVGITKKELIKLTVEIPPELHKKLLISTASKTTKEKRIYIRDIVIEALEEYLK